MAENNKNIDELVKDLMQGFKPEAPSKNVWEKIKRKLFLYNISRRVWFWVFVSSVFVVSFFVFAGSFGDGNPDNIKARYDLRKEVFSLHNAQQNPAQVDDKKKVKKYNENKIASTEEKQSDNLINDHSQRKNNTYINNDGNVISANTNETESNSSNNTVPGNENKDGLVLSGIYNADKENNNHSSDKNKANNIYNDEESKLAWQLLQKKAESENLLKNNNQSYTDQTDFKNINASNLTTSLLSFARPISVSAEIYGGLNYTGFRDQNREPSPIEADSVTLTELNPDWNLSGGIGLRLDYSLFFLQADVNYQSYRTEVKYKWNQTHIIPKNYWDVDTLKSYNIDTIGTFYDSINDNWLYETDTTYYQKIDSNKMTLSDTLVQEHSMSTFQQLQYWEFPILIGHSWNTGNWDIEASTGLAFGFYTGSSGKIIRSGNYEVIQYDKENLPFRDMNMIWIGRAGAAYRFNERWSVLGRVSMRYYLNSIYNDDQLNNRRIWSYGLNFGLRFKL